MFKSQLNLGETGFVSGFDNFVKVQKLLQRLSVLVLQQSCSLAVALR